MARVPGLPLSAPSAPKTRHRHLPQRRVPSTFRTFVRMTSLAYDSRLEHLLDTAADVFAEKGFHATTMRDLARATGMSLAGMYYYVEGKDELLFLIQKRCFAAVHEGAVQATREAKDAPDRIERFVKHHVGFFAEHMSEMKVLSHEADSLNSGRQREVNALKRRYVDLLRRAIEETRNGKNGAWDPRVAAYALFGMMNWIYTWYRPTGSVSPSTLADQFSGLFLHGLLTKTGSSTPHGG